MDLLVEREKRYKPWKAPKMRRRVKTSKLSRIPKNLFKMCKRLFSGLFRSESPYTSPMSAVVDSEHRLKPLQHHQDPDAFIACVIGTDTRKRNWDKTASKVLANCADPRFRLNEGKIEISGICDYKRVLKKLGKSTKVDKLQFGNCSKNLFIPAEAKSKSSEPQSLLQPNYYNYHNNPIGPYDYMPYLPNQHGYGYYPQPAPYVEHGYPSQSHHQGQGYGYYDYHQPHSLPYY